MIENIMVFALGLLTAAFVALLIFPAVNSRAERLARRRVEAQFPLSITELTAEKDHLRAEFAVLQRRIERKAEEALAEKHKDMEEIGRQAVRIETLETDLEGHKQRIAELETAIEEARTRQEVAEATRDDAQLTMSRAKDTLGAVESAHRQTLDELAASRAQINEMTSTLAAVRTELFEAEERLRAREAAYADLETQYTLLLEELDAKRITISDLETRLSTQTARGDEFERIATDGRSELVDERQRLADLARSLHDEQERGMMLEQRIRQLEAERNAHAADAVALTAELTEMRSARDTVLATLDDRSARLRTLEAQVKEADGRLAQVARKDGRRDEAHVAELRTLKDRLEVLKAEKTSLEGALAAAREERAQLENDLQAARRSAETVNAEVRAENAELRRRIDEVAEDILRFAEAKRAHEPAASPAE